MSTGQDSTLEEFLALEMQVLLESENPANNNSNNITQPTKTKNTKSTLNSNNNNNNNNNNPTTTIKTPISFHPLPLPLPQHIHQQESTPNKTCESCSSKNSTLVYCKNCGGYFCLDCEKLFHPVSNQLMNKHIRIPASEVLSHSNPPSLSLPTYSQISNSSTNINIPCSEHPEEDSTYFCLDCEIPAICTECVVHGSHRDHHVQVVRKAFPLIRGKVELLTQNLENKVGELKNVQRKLEDHRIEVYNNAKEIKESMALSFQDLRERLRKKEEELMKNADGFAQSQIEQLQEIQQLVRLKTDELASNIQNMRTRLQDATQTISTQTHLLNYYATNKMILEELVNSANMVGNIDLPQLSQRKCFLDMSSANRQIEALNGLHLIIATLKESPIPTQNSEQPPQPQTAPIPHQRILTPTPTPNPNHHTQTPPSTPKVSSPHHSYNHSLDQSSFPQYNGNSNSSSYNRKSSVIPPTSSQTNKTRLKR